MNVFHKALVVCPRQKFYIRENRGISRGTINLTSLCSIARVYKTIQRRVSAMRKKKKEKRKKRRCIKRNNFSISYQPLNSRKGRSTERPLSLPFFNFYTRDEQTVIQRRLCTNEITNYTTKCNFIGQQLYISRPIVSVPSFFKIIKKKREREKRTGEDYSPFPPRFFPVAIKRKAPLVH